MEPGTDDATRTLERLGLQPDVAEERFDRITRLAGRIFDVLMASITLVDGDRYWFKSKWSIDQDWTPSADSLTQFALSNPHGTIVEDVSKDPRFATHPVVLEHRLRFFAGHPITIGGERVGALCLADRRRQRFNWADRIQLRELATMAEHELVDSEELERAAMVQRTLLPPGPPSAPGWDFAALCTPARSVGGDFLDWMRLPDGRLVMTLADVMGKGIGAGILAATVRAAIRASGVDAGPAEAVRRAAHTVLDDLDRTGSLVTLLQARLDPVSGVLEWADAGHGLQLIIRASGGVERSTRGGMPIGVPGATWSQQTTTLLPGDLLIVFSDGMLELYDGTLAALDEVVRVGLTARDAGAVIAAFADLAAAHPLLDDVTVAVTHRLA